MKNLEVVRFAPGDESTLGAMYELDGDERRFLCFTLEDEARDQKVYGETCIPVGTYEVVLRTVGGFHGRYGETFAEIHKGMLWLQNVPGFEYVLIHCGNDDDDTDGCILVGNSCTQNATEAGALGSSRDAYRRVYPPIADALENGERVALTVREV